MTIPPLSLGIIKGAEWLKALHAEMFLFGQSHGYMNKNAEHTSVHALAGRLQAGPSGNLELTVPSSLIKGVFDALDEPGAEFVVRNNRTECAIKVMTKEEVDKLGGTSHITERGHSYHYTLGPIVELPASGEYDKLWAISIKSNDLEDIRKSYGLETSPQLGFYIPVGCKKKKVTEDNKVSKLAGSAEDPMHVYSYIPSGSIKHVKEHGLLSGNELAKPENRHLLDIARPNGDADRWLKEREEKLIKSPWANTYNGPSVLFGGIDTDKINDLHPIKKFNTTRAKINLHELLRDYPATKLEGSELIPFSDEAYDAMDEKGQNEFVNKRHHTLSPEEIKALIARGQNPKDMWKDFKDTEGKYYASDVPHAKVVTPMGKIPSKYIEFDEELPVSKLAGLLKQSVYWSKDVSRDLLNGRKYPLSYLTGELGELGESVKNMDWPNFKEELGDSAYAAQMILAQKLGLNLPLIGASAPVDKFYARRKGWEEVFKERGVPFSNDYLAGGSNLKKPKKIQAALGLAGHDISKEDARAFALKHGGGIEDDWTDDVGGVSKLAGVYTASGEKVQGVGLRKMYHSLLEEQGLPGIGVNNEDTGDVELSFDGDEAKRQEVFDQLSSRVKAKTGHPVTFAPTTTPQVSVPINLSNREAERLNAIHHLAYRMSDSYDPTDPFMHDPAYFKQNLADRFRLQVNKGGLTGTVPSRAAEHLLGTRPMYAGMMPNRRTRSEEEALSDMAEEQKLRLMKALKGGRGFLAPNESGVSKLASLLKSAGETFKYSDNVDSSPVPTKAQEDINSRSAAMQAKWAPVNAANNLRLQNNEKQRFAALTPEEQNAERQTKRDAYDARINQQLSQGHGLEGASSDFANILPAAQAAKWVGKGLYSGANSLATAAIKSPITPSYIKNTFNPEYSLVRDALKETSRTFGANTPNVSVRGATNASLQAAAENPASSFQQMRAYRKSDYIPGTPGDRTARGTMFASKELPERAGGVYSPYLNHAAVRPVKGTIKAKQYMRHELGHGLQENIPWAETLNGPSFNSFHTTASNNFLGRSFLSEVGANAAESRTPLGQVGRALDFATSPMQLANYWRSYTPAERWVHGTLAAPRAAAYGTGGVTGAYHAIDQAWNAGNDLAETIFPSFSKEKTTSWARPIPPPSQNVPVPTSQQLSNNRPGPAVPATPAQPTGQPARTSLLKKAEGEATPPPIEPISLPSHSPPSGMPAPSIPQGTDFNAMYKAWAKGQLGSGMPARGEGADYARRPVVMRFGSEALGDPQMPVNTSPSGAKQLGTVNFGNMYHTDTDYSRPNYIPAKKISPGVDSGPGVFRVSAHGAGERGNYELSNPGNKPIHIGDGSYTLGMPGSMYNQNPSTVISQACNAGGGGTPATYGNMFKSLNPTNTKSNLNKVVMTPPGFYASGTHPHHPLSVLGESGSAGQPSRYDADAAPYKGNISAYHEYRLAKGGNPSNEAHWTDTGVYNDARQEGLPLVGLGGEVLEMARHFNLSPELGGGNFNSYLDKTRRITSNPDATYQEKVRSSWARHIGSAAELARSSADIVGSADWNNHLRAMQDRSQRKLSKTPAVQTPGLYPGVPIN